MPTGLVLAGGKSRRMGQDKTLLVRGGRPLLAWSVTALRPHCDDILLLGGPHAKRLLPHRDGCRLVADRGEGPLAALLAGARLARGAVILVAPADAPSLVPSVYAALLEAARGKDGAVAWGGDVPDPLVAAYDRAAVVSVATRLLAEGERAPRALSSRLRLARVPVDAALLRDLDRPGDLA